MATTTHTVNCGVHPNIESGTRVFFFLPPMDFGRFSLFARQSLHPQQAASQRRSSSKNSPFSAADETAAVRLIFPPDFANILFSFFSFSTIPFFYRSCCVPLPPPLSRMREDVAALSLSGGEGGRRARGCSRHWNFRSCLCSSEPAKRERPPLVEVSRVMGAFSRCAYNGTA